MTIFYISGTMSGKTPTDWEAVERVRKTIVENERKYGKRDEEGREQLERMVKAAEENEANDLISPNQQFKLAAKKLLQS